MTTLVLGASGATGKQLVNQLLQKGQTVKVIVRPASKIPDAWINAVNLVLIKAEVSALSSEEMAAHIKDCQAVACCLGHTISLKGIYGKPRRLVTHAVQGVCQAILKLKPATPVKFVLMNTVAHRNKDLDEKVPVSQKIVLGMIRLLLPPQPDNEQAAEYLRVQIGQKNPYLEWVAVRPDSLQNEDHVSDYEVVPSPTRNPIFNPGKTSRINVGHFMASLVLDPELWDKWKGQMPVIYNKMSNLPGPTQA